MKSWLRLGVFLLLGSVCCIAWAGNRSPMKNFNHLWNAFQENYAFFHLRKVSWKSIRKRYKPRVKKTKTKKELFCVLNSMLSHFRDGHVSLSAEDYDVDDCQLSNVPPDPSNRFAALAHRLAERHVIAMQTYKNGAIRWGKLKKQPDVGYIQINELEKLVDCKALVALRVREINKTKAPKDYLVAQRKLPNDDDEEDDDVVDRRKLWAETLCGDINDVEATVTIVREILQQFKALKGIVLDIRFNVGGEDEVALAIMGHFAKSKVLVYSKREMNDGKLSKLKKMYLKPHPKRYRTQQKAVLLVSQMTMSAAEILALAARQLPNVTLVGSRTQGILSNMAHAYLPIGWKYTLSDEIYYSPNGHTYEKIGVPPQHFVPYPRHNPTKLYQMLNAPEDVALTKALFLLSSPKAPSPQPAHR